MSSRVAFRPFLYNFCLNGYHLRASVSDCGRETIGLWVEDEDDVGCCWEDFKATPQEQFNSPRRYPRA